VSEISIVSSFYIIAAPDIQSPNSFHSIVNSFQNSNFKQAVTKLFFF
jgi:hypothetical protein